MLIPVLYFLVVLDVMAQFNDGSIAFINLHRETICKTARLVNIPPESIAGVIIAEKTLNHGLLDDMQDVYISYLVNNKNVIWWNDWAASSEQIAKNIMHIRLISNKWPIELSKNGYVISIGMAQITPRTAIHACNKMNHIISACKGSVKSIVSNLLVTKKAIEIAAAIIAFEKLEHIKITSEPSVINLALLGTLYNLGGDYYRKTFLSKFNTQYNMFGRWVENNEIILKTHLKCDAYNFVVTK